VLHNWGREFCNWTPDIKVVVYDGSAEERGHIRADRLKNQTFNVVLTHYDLVNRDKAVFRKVIRTSSQIQFIGDQIKWEYLIVDEGHRLKNSESKLFEILSIMTSRCRLLLTGTPVQNSLTELWSLLNFLLPKVFNSSETFDEWFAAPFKVTLHSSPRNSTGRRCQGIYGGHIGRAPGGGTPFNHKPPPSSHTSLHVATD